MYGDRQWKCNEDLHNFSIIESDHVLTAVYLLKIILFKTKICNKKLNIYNKITGLANDILYPSDVILI